MNPPGTTLIHWAGLAALIAGLLFAGIQSLYPPDTLASVTTGTWAVITPVKTVMCLLFLVGLTGFVLLGLSWLLQTAFAFAEAFILPLLAQTAPAFVSGSLGLASGVSSEVQLGPLPALYTFVGLSEVPRC